MIKIIGSYYFPGFYESVFNGSDDFIDDELEVKDGLDVDGVNVEYEYVDFDKYKVDVSSKFMEVYVDTILEVLPDFIVEDEKFEFEIIDGSVWVVSPKYYNYETDKCYCEVKTNIETLMLIKDYVLSMVGVDEYIVNHFTSYDGFISFLSNDVDYWRSLPISDYEENMLISLLDMLLKLSDNEIFDRISFEVMDSVCKYEYVLCYVEYENRKYTLDEFYKLR